MSAQFREYGSSIKKATNVSPSLLLECDPVGEVGEHRDPSNLCFEGGGVILLKKVIAASPQTKKSHPFGWLNN